MSLGVGPLVGKNPPETEAAYQTVLKACLAQTKVVCGAGDQASNIQNRVKEGFSFCCHSAGEPRALINRGRRPATPARI